MGKRKIVYDVAITLDGFICRPDGSAAGFVPDGEHVTDYQQRLQQYDTVLMGRKTYEFGYAFGLEAGRRAYPHMQHLIVSDTLKFDSDQVEVVARDRIIERITQLCETPGSDIYLCGGGQLAGLLLDHKLVNRWVIKLNPILFSTGVRAFGGSRQSVALTLRAHKAYGNGVTLLDYEVEYPE